MKPFSAAAAILLALVSLGHLTRILLRWEVVVNATVVVPAWASGVAFLVTAALAVGVWREGCRANPRPQDRA